MAKRAAPKKEAQLELALPVVSIYRQHDRVSQFLQIMQEHDRGSFQRSAGLVDEIMTDDRIQGVVGARIGAIVSAPMKFESGGSSKRHIEVAESIAGNKEQRGTAHEMFSKATAAEILKWSDMLGIGYGQIAWEKTTTYWQPRIIPWHPQHLLWDEMSRRFVVMTERGGWVTLPRVDEQPRSDGQWFIFCPYGVQYGWRSALIRSLCWKYLSRQWTERDWDRHNERQGLGMVKAKVPAGNSQPQQREEFFRQLRNAGSETVVLTPQDEKGNGYDVSVVEFTARTWEGMKERRAALDADIAIAVLGQNLTTEVKEGSRAAAAVHEIMRLDKALADAEMAEVFRAQVLTWFCEYNFGDPELAPVVKYEVEPPADARGEAEALELLGRAVQQLTLAEPRVDGTAIMEIHGVPLISEEEMAALEAEAEEARAAAAAAAPAPGDDEAEGGEEAQPPDRAALSAATGIERRYNFAGLEIAVENPAGSIRLWQHPDGRQGSTRMLCDYGFIEGAFSGDDEEVDVYVGSDPEARDVYVVHQLRTPDYRAHDEDKVMLGFPTLEAARACYAAHRDDAERAISGISVIPLERFRAKLRRRGAESTRKIHASVADTTRTLVALASRSKGRIRPHRTVAGRERAARYQEALVARHVAAAARVLAPALSGLKAELDGATSLADLRRAVIRKYRGQDNIAPLAKILTQMGVLAKLSGERAAREEV